MAVFYTQPQTFTQGIPQKPKVPEWAGPQGGIKPQPWMQPSPIIPRRRPRISPSGDFPSTHSSSGTLASSGGSFGALARFPGGSPVAQSLVGGLVPYGSPGAVVPPRSGISSGLTAQQQIMSPWARFAMDQIRQSPQVLTSGQPAQPRILSVQGQPAQPAIPQVGGQIPGVRPRTDLLRSLVQQTKTSAMVGGQAPGIPQEQPTGQIPGAQPPTDLLQFFSPQTKPLAGQVTGLGSEMVEAPVSPQYMPWLPPMFTRPSNYGDVNTSVYGTIPSLIGNLTTDIEKQKNDVLALMDIEKGKAINDALARLSAGGNLSQGAADAMSLAIEAQYSAKKGALAAELEQQKIQNELAATQVLGQLAESQGNLYLKSWAQQYQAWLEQRAADLNEERTRFEMRETLIGDMLAAWYNLAVLSADVEDKEKKLWEMLDYVRRAWEQGELPSPYGEKPPWTN